MSSLSLSKRSLAVGQVLKPSEARELARQRGMDLVEVDGAQRPPVCKLQLAGKALFLAAQKEKVRPQRPLVP